MNEATKEKVDRYEAEVKELTGKCNEIEEASSKMMKELFALIGNEGSESMKSLASKLDSNADEVCKIQERLHAIKQAVVKIAFVEAARAFVEKEGDEA